MMLKKSILVSLIVITLIGFILRFYKLGVVPDGLYQDETAIGFNAYSLLQTGKDEYGQPYPMYFKSFGDYKLPVYIYATALSVKIFGLNAFAVRFPSAFFGLLTIPFFYLLVKKITNDQKLAIIAAAILAINPWHIHYNRATFEVSLSLFFFVVGSFWLLQAEEHKKRGFFIAGTLLFIVGLYSYNLTRILAPLLYCLILWHKKKQKVHINKIEIFATLVLSILLLLPFFLTISQSGGTHSASGTLIWSSAAVQAPLIELRSYMIGLPTVLQKLFFNIPFLTLYQYLRNIVSYASVSFFFLTGSPHGNHGIGTMGQFYLFELPFFLIGIFSIIQRKYAWKQPVLGWAVVSILVASLTRETPHATRSFFLIVPYIIFIAEGNKNVLLYINSLTKSYKFVGFAGFFLIIFTSFFWYLSSYFIRFPIAYAKDWRFDDRIVSQFIRDNESSYDRVIFDSDAGFKYTSLLFYLSYSPTDFLNTVKRTPDDSEGFTEVTSFGKYEFRKIDWVNDMRLQNSLIITSEKNKPSDISVFRTFPLPKRPVVFSVKQDIISYPVEESGYVVVNTN